MQKNHTQFVLRPAAIIFDVGSALRANVTEADRQLLIERQEASGALKTERTAKTASSSGQPPVTVRRYEFSPIQPTSTRDLLKDIDGVHAADEFSVAHSEGIIKLTFYYNQRPEAGPQVLGSELEGSVAQSVLSWLEVLLAGRRSSNPHSRQHERLYKDFAGSPYLELVLHNLREMILQHLAGPGSEFEDVVGNPFLLQFFLLFSTEPEPDRTGVMSHTLRYFPLKAERERFQAAPIDTEILRRLSAQSLQLAPTQSPSDFSRHYAWRASTSLVGYSYETGAARYFENWQDEPMTQGGDDTDRDIVTTIMQTVRGDTPHQFTIPLFANREKIGAIIINTKSAISEAGRLLSIRCARGAGLPLEMALNMDDEVNKITAKLTQARTYRHMLSSLLHEEGRYCILLGRFWDSVYSSPTPNDSMDRLKSQVLHIIKDRRQLVDEFNTSPRDRGTGVIDPIRNIPASAIFHGLGERQDTTEAQLNDGVDILKAVFPQAKRLNTKVSIESQNSNRTTVPAVKTIVLRRIMSNLLRNTAKVGREVDNPSLELSFKAVKHVDRSYLEIVATDNCGGFEAGFPLGEISFEMWSNYLTVLEKRGPTVHGMGFLTLLKYTSSTKGLFRAENIRNDDGTAGARITLRIGLQERKAEA